MVTRLPKLKIAPPHDWIDTLNRNAVETSPAQEDDRTNSARVDEGEGEPEIPNLPGVPDHQSSLPDESFKVIESANSVAPIFSGSTAAVPAAESGTSPVPPPVWMMVVPDSLPFLNFDTPACRRLIRHAFAPHELPSLVEAIFSSKDESGIVRCLNGDDAQIFIDVIDEVRSALPPYHGI
jgi:hypothetical protein